MVLRNIVHIDQEKCDGCGQCVDACAEGAIELIDGKANLMSESYCDGLGACLGECPQGAITIEQRQAEAFDEAAVEAHLHRNVPPSSPGAFGCPGLANQQLRRQAEPGEAEPGGEAGTLSSWPVQLKLISEQSPAFNEAHVLLSADCVPFAMGDFHQRLLKGRTLVVGCPKLDDASFYAEKLASILRNNPVKSLAVVHMEVPCCSGLTQIARQAVGQSGKVLPLEDITIDLQGRILDVQQLADGRAEAAKP